MAATTTEADVRELSDRMLEAMNRGDRDGLRSCLSEDSSAVHIGTDADEWWSSAQVIETVGGAGRSSGIKVISDELTIQPLGVDAASFVGRGRFVAGEREQSMRYSGAARREGDRWVVVHSHASIGVPNEDLLEVGTCLETSARSETAATRWPFPRVRAQGVRASGLRG